MQDNITQQVKYGISPLTDQDIYLFKEGNYFRLYEKLGAHIMNINGIEGTYFGVWAPNAESVSVKGDFNNWNNDSHQLSSRWDSSGIWEGFIPEVSEGTLYKYFIKSKYNNYSIDKKDPLGFFCEVPPKTASIVWNLDFKWSDKKWLSSRGKCNSLNSPMSIYEVHMGSWMRVPEDGNRSLNYDEMADKLSKYAQEMGYTHVEFMPLMAHPFFGSWGYQTDGYFSPSSMFGNPQAMMHMIDTLHKNNIGVIIDWVPSHFPEDGHSIGYFDGTRLYEHEDPKKGFHPDWKSNIFNYGRNEVRCFLISSALFWLDKYHVDGLRVDGVASMLYLDYSRKEGEWIPNQYGGRENLEATDFLRRMNEVVYSNYPDVQVIAEESTSWPMVSKPTFVGGLGFGMKWNMGWMHDTLGYFKQDSLFRKYHQNELTFSSLYMFSENFLLSLSHDEVVHGKGSLLGRMPGDEWQRFANLRCLYGYMYGHPGKKLLFMGCEFGQVSEWNHESSLEWHVLEYPCHKGMQKWVQDLNKVYRKEPAMFENDYNSEGFEWIDCSDNANSVISFLRKGKDREDKIIIVCNFTPQTLENYKIGVPKQGFWKELLNSDAEVYWGSGQGNAGGTYAINIPCHNRPFSISIKLPPLSILFLKQVETKE